MNILRDVELVDKRPTTGVYTTGQVVSDSAVFFMHRPFLFCCCDVTCVGFTDYAVQCIWRDVVIPDGQTPLTAQEPVSFGWESRRSVVAGRICLLLVWVDKWWMH